MSSSAASLYICPPIFSTVPVNSNSSKVASKIFISICVFAWIASISSIPSFRAFSILLCVLPNSPGFIFLVPESLCSIWTVADLESRTLEIILPEYLQHCRRAWHVAVQSDCLHLHLLLNRFFRELQKTSRFCSNANAAVIFAPLFFRASVTTMPMDKPLIMRLRMGKLLTSGFTPRGNSETKAPLFVISSASFLFSGG